MAFSPEIRFCVKYLLEHGISVADFEEVVSSLTGDENRYEIVPIYEQEQDFFDELAGKLRELWPPGEKNGKYPWRDSVANLSRRLKSLWDIRQLKNYSIEDCLAVARRYLAQFENDVRFMMVLKYFIMKQKSIVEKNGRERIITDSRFADMLESASDFEKMDDEWSAILNETQDIGDII